MICLRQLPFKKATVPSTGRSPPQHRNTVCFDWGHRTVDHTRCPKPGPWMPERHENAMLDVRRRIQMGLPEKWNIQTPKICSGYENGESMGRLYIFTWMENKIKIKTHAGRYIIHGLYGYIIRIWCNMYEVNHGCSCTITGDLRVGFEIFKPTKTRI